jgi:hypothetical protein
MKRVDIFSSAVLVLNVNAFFGGFLQSVSQAQGQVVASSEIRQQSCQSNCLTELLSSDENQDGQVNSTEYLNFAQQLGLLEESLPLSLRATFNLLACSCVQYGMGERCCSDGSTHIDIDLAQQNEDYLCSVCWSSEQSVSQMAPTVTPTDVASTYPTLESQFSSMVPSSVPTTYAASHAPSVSPSLSSAPSTTPAIPTASPADNVFRKPTAVPTLVPHKAPLELHFPSIMPSSLPTFAARPISIVASLPPSIPSLNPNPSVGDSDISTTVTVGIALFGGLSLLLCFTFWYLRRVLSRTHLLERSMSGRTIQDNEKEKSLLDIDTGNGNSMLQMHDKARMPTIDEKHEWELEESETTATSPSSQGQSSVPDHIEQGQDTADGNSLLPPLLPLLLWDDTSILRKQESRRRRRRPGPSLWVPKLILPFTRPIDPLLAPMDNDSSDEFLYDDQPIEI